MPAPSPHLPEGTFLGRYRVEAFVDEGGMGAVYRAHDPKLDRPVALKALRIKHRRDAAALARFQREAQVLAQLNHPNICQVYDWVEAEGATYMAMEWVEGPTLEQRMGKTWTPMTPAAALPILTAIASALAAAHAKEIIHRDLKPGNVILTPDGRVKVLDFGLAKRVDERSGAHPAPLRLPAGEWPEQVTLAASGPEADPAGQTLAGPTVGPASGQSSSASSPLTTAGFIMGTLGYMSPEQALQRPLGPPSDVFALGILAHELLVGHRPFEGTGQDLLVAVASNQRVPLWERPGPARLWKLIERMLDPDPKARPGAAEVVTSLQSLDRPLGPKGWAAVAAGLTLVVTTGAFWLSSRSIIADLARDRPARLAVLPLANETGAADLDPQVQVALPELLSTALRGSPRLALLEPEETRRIAGRFPPASSGAPALARALGAQLLLRGSLRREGGEEVLTLILEDATGRARLRQEIRQPHHPEFVGQVYLEEATHRILKAIDPGTSPRAPGPRVPPESVAAYARGTLLMSKGEYRQAEPLLREAAHQAPQFALLVGRYASCLMRQGSDKTPAVCEWARFAGLAAGDKGGQLIALQIQAYWAERTGDPGTAEGRFLQALELSRDMKDTGRESSILDSLGRLAQSRGHEDHARTYYERGLALALQNGDLEVQGSIRTNLANLALAHGDLQDAERQYQQVLISARALEDRAGQAIAENNLGVVGLSQQRMVEAQPHLLRALELRRDLGDRYGEASTLRNLGILETMRGDLAAARVRLEASLRVAVASNLAVQVAAARYRLGEVARLEGKWDAAISHFLAALEGHRRVEAKRGEADDLAGWAECLARKPGPDWRAADAAVARSLELAPDRPQALRARAWIRHLKGQRAEALQDLERALEDPGHDAPEAHQELLDLRERFRAEPRR